MDDSLPGRDFWALIHPHTGDVTGARPSTRGFSSDLTATLACEKGPFFVKAVRNRRGGRRDSLVRERLINPFVHPISPVLRWHTEDEEWVALGFEVVEGRPARFEPDSTDLPEIVGVLNRIGQLELPEVAQGWPETRWNRYAETEAEVALFEGDALLHTDINPSNLIIGRRATWAVDWAWPTRGAGFIDPACLVMQLIATGHTAKAAEGWADGCPAWAEADPYAIDAFAAATLRMYRLRAERTGHEWLRAMVEAARAWALHRGVSVER
ncbi:phosphotransferase [Streptomyces sp. 8N114]|uniref:phosphotransferase n=1 Tax=Streptomyces sp. 8N114 TaxID=3457419 RepID=UPI003FD3EA71